MKLQKENVFGNKDHFQIFMRKSFEPIELIFERKRRKRLAGDLASSTEDIWLGKQKAMQPN